MKFIILGIPKPKQSARFRAIKSGNKTFIKSYQKKEVVDNERNIAYDIKSQLPVGFIPFDCPVAITVLFVFPPLKSFSKKVLQDISEGKIVYKDTKPDLDNIFKNLGDAMEGILYTNDARICTKESKKIYGLMPRIEIEISELT